jgi:hypothetical protein
MKVGVLPANRTFQSEYCVFPIRFSWPAELRADITAAGEERQGISGRHDGEEQSINHQPQLQ